MGAPNIIKLPFLRAKVFFVNCINKLMGCSNLTMEDYGTNSFDGKIYLIFLCKGTVNDDKSSVFMMPVLVAFIGFE